MDRVRGVGDRTSVADDLRTRKGDVVMGSWILCQCRRVAPCLVALSLTVAPGFAADDSTAAWAALVKGGHVALIRHGNAPPGYGDPPGFKIDDCKTQRNLDERGREQARALGEAFRQHGVRVDLVLSSPWCRCLETARLLAVGPVETSWALIPMQPSATGRLHELQELVAAWRGPGTLVLVTHGFTVQALLGFLPDQGATVVLKPGSGNAAKADLVGLIAGAH
jgi:phosphohistidine phosphatase SixA